MKPTDLDEDLHQGLLQVLQEAHYTGVAVQSNTARGMAGYVAAAASLGLITTKCPEGYGRRWRLTRRGLTFLEREQ